MKRVKFQIMTFIIDINVKSNTISEKTILIMFCLILIIILSKMQMILYHNIFTLLMSEGEYLSRSRSG
jgi:hypothetical protein